MSTRIFRIRRFASMTISIKFVWLLCLATQVDYVVGRGPDTFEALPVWRFSMLNCSLFRNETVLRPKFGIWPEEAGSVPFRYCCEYQSNGASSTFELSNYTYGPDDGTLQPAPYYDLGIVEKVNFKDFWRPHWGFWSLPQKQFSEPMLYCDVTDLRVLYRYRFWHKAMKRGAATWAFLLALFVALLTPLLCLGYIYHEGIYSPDREPADVTAKDFYNSCKDLAKAAGVAWILLSCSIGASLWRACTQRQEGSNDVPAVAAENTSEVQADAHTVGNRHQDDPPSLDLEEAFADTCHILLLALVSSCLMEGIAHSPLRSWRSELMFNAAVTYTFLTLFATISTWIRHCLLLELRHHRDWRWQKIFGQFAAQFMVGTYLVLVDDVTGHSLDSFAGPVVGTCVAASVWSAGVELVVIVQYGWQKLLHPLCVYFKGKIRKRCKNPGPGEHSKRERSPCLPSSSTARPPAEDMELQTTNSDLEQGHAPLIKRRSTSARPSTE